MTPNNTVIVAQRDIVSALREHLRPDPSVMIWDASEAAPAVSLVAASVQTMLAIGRSFADAPAALPFIEQVRMTHPATDVRVLTDDAAGVPQLLKTVIKPPAHLAVRSASHPLVRQTRRAPRHAAPAGATAIVNGTSVRLVNVSLLGVQIVSAEIVRPGQRAQLVLGAPPKALRIEALVAWSTLEMERQTRHVYFRAGLAFANAAPEIEREILGAGRGR